MPDLTPKSRQDFLPSHRLEKLSPRSGENHDWPEIDGQLIIAFSSRVGSSFLCSEIERSRVVPHVREAFNETPLKLAMEKFGYQTMERAAIEQIREMQREGWFVAKAGLPGLSTAEQYGLIDHYFDRTHFIFLLRRDVAAQAISIATAKMTGQYSSLHEPMRDVADSDYSESALVRPLTAIFKACERLESYLAAAKRPTDLLFYEDFKSGDFAKPHAILDRIGLPRRPDPPEVRRRDLQPVTRSVSAEWGDRLRRIPQARPLIDKYTALVERVTERYG